MPKAKNFTKEDIVRAMNVTHSNRSAARYLHCSYQHYKKWAKFYKDEETGKSLFEIHLNPSGKGIPKFLNNGKKHHALIDIIEGRVNAASFAPEKMKFRLITEGYLLEECAECGFKERRVLDYKMPLLLHFKDKNKKNYRQENIELLCYNCYFIYQGDIFTDKQIKGMEDHVSVSLSKVEWEMDDYHLQRLKELGLGDEEPEEYDIIARK
jgi:hypothetical protein